MAGLRPAAVAIHRALIYQIEEAGTNKLHPPASLRLSADASLLFAVAD
jgi:hypothetical protein